MLNGTAFIGKSLPNQSTAFMTSPIGDLTIDSAGLRKAIDKISELMAENRNLTAENAILKTDLARASERPL